MKKRSLSTSETDISFYTVNKSLFILERQWIEECLPIIVQVKTDALKGNEFQALFYEFDHDNKKCTIQLVFTGESAYRPYRVSVRNRFLTFFYRSFNRCVYKRTSDVDSFIYYDVDLNYKDTRRHPWGGIQSIDYSGPTQNLTHGDKCNFGISIIGDRQAAECYAQTIRPKTSFLYPYDIMKHTLNTKRRITSLCYSTDIN
ncbi:hypothetical protein WA158_001983 [Blastocystis sp. Blastoise]